MKTDLQPSPAPQFPRLYAVGSRDPATSPFSSRDCQRNITGGKTIGTGHSEIPNGARNEGRSLQIPDSLVASVVHNALEAPYRQTRPMQAREFVRWLKDRDVNISFEALLFLASEGIFPPIAWEVPPDSVSTERLVSVEIGELGLVYGDRGETPDLKQLLEPTPTRIDQDRSWWHPFQLWRATRVTMCLEISIASFQGLYGPDRYTQLADRLFQHLDPRERLVRLTTGERWFESFAVIGMLLAAEPLVIEAVTGRITTDTVRGETFEGMFTWRQEINHDSLLRENHCSVEMMRRWHEESRHRRRTWRSSEYVA